MVRMSSLRRLIVLGLVIAGGVLVGAATPVRVTAPAQIAPSAAPADLAAVEARVDPEPRGGRVVLTGTPDPTEAPVAATEAPAAPTEAYWQSRPLDARIAAIASDQSAPIASRAELLAKVAAVAARGDDDPPRPERWIGYRVWAEHVELWVSQPARIHDRAVWTRPLTPSPGGFTGGPWEATRLQP